MDTPPQTTQPPPATTQPWWVVATVLGALLGVVSTGIIWVLLSNRKLECTRAGADLLRVNEALPFYCGFVAPDLNIALWAVVLGLIIGVFMAAVIGIRGRR